MTGLLQLAVASAVALFGTAAAASPKLVAVLPLDVREAELDTAARVTLEEVVRTVTGEVLFPLGYTVLTGENTLEVLGENGVDPAAACETGCALELARLLRAELFLSGVVTFSEDHYLAFVRLFDSTAGRQLGSLQLEGQSVRDIRRAFVEKAPILFARIDSASSGVERVRPVDRPPPEPVRADSPPLAGSMFHTVPLTVRAGLGMRYGMFGMGTELRVAGPIHLNAGIGVVGASAGLSVGPTATKSGWYLDAYRLFGFFPGIHLTGANGGYDFRVGRVSLRAGLGVMYVDDLGTALPFFDFSAGSTFGGRPLPGGT